MSIAIEKTLVRLKRSPFRSSFHLSKKAYEYFKEKGTDTIQKHADNFIHTRLGPDFPRNDGKQTPMKGHPVFIAQHATATCCRSCLEKWHQIPKGRPLTKEEENAIVMLLMKWLEQESKNFL